jgi:hypothetical protein
MSTEGHKRGQRGGYLQRGKAEMDKELSEIRAKMERLAFKMRQEAKVRWRYEWPLRRTTKWTIRKLLAQNQQQVLRRWLRHVENLIDEGKRSGRGLEGCQVGNNKGSMDLVDCQGGRGDIPTCQVGKGGEMTSTESSCQGVLTDGEEAEEIPRSDGDSPGTVNRVNEDDENLNNSTTEEKDHRNILVIGGVKIFLPRIQGEASTDVTCTEERGITS